MHLVDQKGLKTRAQMLQVIIILGNEYRKFQLNLTSILNRSDIYFFKSKYSLQNLKWNFNSVINLKFSK